MKPLILLCTALLIAPLVAQETPAKIVDIKAADAIELVKKDSADTKADPKKQPLIVLDVRTPKEYADAHLAGATNLDYHAKTFKEALAKLDKSKPYLVHCAVGGRSKQTCDLMKALGFKSVYHLEGGLTAWQKAGGPVTPPAKE